jgi:predicted nucleotidyltransferase
MITEAEKKIIKKISRKYNIKRVLLFGSCLLPDKESADIDIAIEGISPQDFYKFYGDLLFSLPKPVDILDLSGTSKFIQIIQQEGIPLYG